MRIPTHPLPARAVALLTATALFATSAVGCARQESDDDYALVRVHLPLMSETGIEVETEPGLIVVDADGKVEDGTATIDVTFTNADGDEIASATVSTDSDNAGAPEDGAVGSGSIEFVAQPGEIEDVNVPFTWGGGAPASGMNLAFEFQKGPKINTFTSSPSPYGQPGYPVTISIDAEDQDGDPSTLDVAALFKSGDDIVRGPEALAFDPTSGNYKGMIHSPAQPGEYTLAITSSDANGSTTETSKTYTVEPLALDMGDKGASTQGINGFTDKPGAGQGETVESAILRDALTDAGFDFVQGVEVLGFQALADQALPHEVGETHEIYDGGDGTMALLRVTSDGPYAATWNAETSEVTLLGVTVSGEVSASAYAIETASDLVALLEENKAGEEYVPGSSPSVAGEDVSILESAPNDTIVPYVNGGAVGLVDLLAFETIALSNAYSVLGGQVVPMALLGINWWCGGAYTLKAAGYAACAAGLVAACGPICIALGFVSAGAATPGCLAACGAGGGVPCTALVDRVVAWHYKGLWP